MRSRKLGWTDLELTTVGLGTWAMGGGDWEFAWGPQEDHESIKAICRALDLGINWIDTAPVYGLGHAEEVVGKALMNIQSKPIIATKCCRLWDSKGQIFGSLRKGSVRREAEDSLKRIKVEVIDLLQIHWPVPDEEIEEGWDTIARLIQEGKVRYGGLSNFNIEQMKRIQPMHPIASLQPPYSMLRREIEDEILDFCEENRIGLIVYSPLQKGLLSGKMNKERIMHLPFDDHRRKDPMFQEPKIDDILELVDQLKPIAIRSEKTMAQLAIAWVLNHSAITSAIVGTRKPSQIEETAIASDWDLSEEENEMIETIFEKIKK